MVGLESEQITWVHIPTLPFANRVIRRKLTPLHKPLVSQLDTWTIIVSTFWGLVRLLSVEVINIVPSGT